ncbi:hypothetical protein WJX74_009893 [Apatococcus lobatus]|uniref:Sphingomyelin phosphodiesterase 4 n=1 Tax=Apatococcus lobatus TaxID=904363 RepID=A0AAW1RXH8_9CHLO
MIASQSLLALLEGPSKVTIAQSCQAVTGCLEANRDNLRVFFVQCFPALLKQLFGYDGSSWLTTASKNQNDEDAQALISLLAPSGSLMQAMFSADLDNLVMFNFPLERLPTYTQVLLNSDAGRQVAKQWPQYQQSLQLDSAGKPQLHLGVMLYFFFWTAFFVLRGTQPAISQASMLGPTSQSRVGVSGWTHRAPLRSKMRRVAGPLGNGIYLQLLRMYFENFMPQDPDAGRGGRSGLGQSLLSIMVEFWLLDSEVPQPGAAAAAAQHQQQQQARAMRSLLSSSLLRAQRFEPPPTELMEGLCLLARHVTAREEPSKPIRSAQSLPNSWLPWTPVRPFTTPKTGKEAGFAHKLGAAGRPPAQAFACHLYRFLRRGFTMWPHQRSITPLVSLYLAYATPWVPSESDSARVSFRAGPVRPTAEASRHLAKQVSGLFAHAFGENSPSSKGAQQPQRATNFVLGEWQLHVLANMPFFSLLLPMLLDLEASRLAAGSRPDSQELLQVLSALTAAPGLGDMLKLVEAAYNAMLNQQADWTDSPYSEFLPAISEQACEWEAAATVDASSLPSSQAPAAPSFRLFDTGPEGASAVLQRIRASAAHSTGAQDDAFQQAMAMGCALLPAFDGGAGTSAPGQPASGLSPAPSQPASQGLKLANLSQVHYRGDDMQRPIASYEIGWLVRLLVWVSISLNQALQLGPSSTGSPDAPDFWGLLRWARRKGIKINLRPAAELQMLAWLLIGGFVLVYSLKLLSRIVLALAYVCFGHHHAASTSLVPMDQQQELAQIEQQLSQMVTPP